MTKLTAALVATSLLLGGSGLGGIARARAQDERDARVAEALAAETLRIRDERRDAGLALLSYGLASVVGGALMAGIGNEDPRWLGAGLGTLGWGAVNAALSIGLFDFGAADREAAVQRLMRGRTLERERQDRARSHYASASVFALNLGLDVFYVASGILLAFLATELDRPEPTLEGYGWAMAGQGLGLFVFDLVEWCAAVGRGDRLHDLGAEP